VFFEPISFSFDSEDRERGLSMSDAEIDEDAAIDGEDGESEGQGKKKLSGKVLVLYIALPLFLVLVGGGAATYFLLFSGQDEVVSESMTDPNAPKTVVFYDLPEMLVNLNTGSGKRKTYLKVLISLELESTDAVTEIEQVMPRIVDSFQVYLRDLRVEDLQGSAGLMRLKDELLTRLNATVRPVKVNDVLFREMLVQ
jgi:flagellar FliL protein